MHAQVAITDAAWSSISVKTSASKLYPPWHPLPCSYLAYGVAIDNVLYRIAVEALKSNIQFHCMFTLVVTSNNNNSSFTWNVLGDLWVFHFVSTRAANLLNFSGRLLGPVNSAVAVTIILKTTTAHHVDIQALHISSIVSYLAWQGVSQNCFLLLL